MSLLILTIIAALFYGMALAITLAKRAGYFGLFGFLRWCLLAIAREAWVTAEALGEFEKHRMYQRQAWNERVRFGEVR